MRVLLPYYHPAASPVHRLAPDVKIGFLAIVLVMCWLGVYRLPLTLGYGLLLLLLGVSLWALAAATNRTAAARMFLLPAFVGLTWSVLYLGIEAFHWWGHRAGRVDDGAMGPLGWHIAERLAFDLRRVVALFCAAASASAFVVSTSVADLRRSRIVPARAVPSIELFMSMFARFQARVRRILYAHHLVGHGMTLRGMVRWGPSNSLVLAGEGLVVFVISVLRDIPAIFNARAGRESLTSAPPDGREPGP